MSISDNVVMVNELNELIMFIAKYEGFSISHIDAQGKIKAKYLVAEIRKTFELDKSWTTTSHYIPDLKKSTTIYPQLYKTEQYDEWLHKMKKDNEENEK